MSASALCAMFALLTQGLPQSLPPSSPAHGLTFASDVELPTGYGLVGEREIEPYAMFAPISNGRTLVFDGLHVDVIGALGQLERRVATLPSFCFPSFVVADPTLPRAWIAESTHDAVLAVDLVSGAVTALASIHFAYDATYESPTSLLVSASPCGFSCGTELIRLDVASGFATTLADLGGASGPVAIDASGGLLYAFQASAIPLPGQIGIAGWSAALLASGHALDATNATKRVTGLDGAGAMDCDRRGGHLFVAQSRFNGPSEILEIDASGRVVASFAHTARWISNVKVEELDVASGPHGVMQPLQPRGARLHWLETDFTTFPARTLQRAIEPVRPRAWIERPAVGAPLLHLAGAPAFARVTLRSASLGGHGLVETPRAQGDAIVFTVPELVGAPGLELRADAEGEIELALSAAPNGAPTTIGGRVHQFFVHAGRGAFPGSSNPVPE